MIGPEGESTRNCHPGTPALTRSRMWRPMPATSPVEGTTSTVLIDVTVGGAQQRGTRRRRGLTHPEPSSRREKRFESRDQTVHWPPNTASRTR